MNLKITLKEFLGISRQVTDNYIKALNGKEWSLSDQWNKIMEEEQEFKVATSPRNELEEFWDNFFAKLTLLHLEKIDDSAIMESAIFTWNKIYERSWKAIEAEVQ